MRTRVSVATTMRRFFLAGVILISGPVVFLQVTGQPATAQFSAESQSLDTMLRIVAVCGASAVAFLVVTTVLSWLISFVFRGLGFAGELALCGPFLLLGIFVGQGHDLLSHLTQRATVRSESQAIELAKAYCDTHNLEYDDRQWRAQPLDGEWTVFIEARPPATGGTASVEINREGEVIAFVGGGRSRP